MPNELLFIISLVICFFGVLITYKIFGKVGLYIWIGLATVVANIEVLVVVDVFGLTCALGNVVYGSCFLVTDILNEKHGKKEALRAIWIGFFTMFVFTVLIQITLLFTVNAEQDFSSEAMHTIFGIMPRICIVSLVVYLISNTIDVYLFRFVSKCTKGRHLWLRNNLSTIVSQLIDTILFTLGAYLGIYSYEIMFEIIVTALIMKIIVALFDTPFLYYAKYKIVESEEDKTIECEKERVIEEESNTTK